MGLASDAVSLALHPSQLKNLVHWKLRNGPIHARNKKLEASTAKVCFEFLDKTGRSFSPVIQELHPELCLPVCVFYLILRGLDTIEDDTSIPLETKEPLLRGFKGSLEIDGWTFTGNRPEEKDRQLLVQFDNVVAEFKKLKPVYREIIKDVTAKMGNGMADFARKAAFGDTSVNTVEEYDLYCWYVAGVVGEGLTRLFVEAGLGDETLVENAPLHNSMSLLLQKNNIIRDIREDRDDGRRFWPKEIWSKHVNDFEDLFNPENLELALDCSSEMILDALRHTTDCLSYLAGLREQSVFNFCAIPQSMALATLELCFRNPAVFQRNVKIARGDAFQLVLDSSQSLEKVCEVFCRYVQGIQQKNGGKNPHYLDINIACDQIKKFATTLAKNNNVAKGKIAMNGSSIGEQQDQQRSGRNVKSWNSAGQMFAILAFISTLMLGVAWVMSWSPKTIFPQCLSSGEAQQGCQCTDF